MSVSDEDYIIGICDRVLGLTAKRQCRFDFLRGDPGKKNGLCTMLPVDAYYETATFKLVIEYREPQHTVDHPFFNRRPGRQEQRRHYDQLRREVLPKHGIILIELEFTLFARDSRKRLKRDVEADERVIREKLASFIDGHQVQAYGNTPCRVVSPEEEELANKRRELALLLADLADRELSLACRKAELAALEGQYLREVGVLYAELDECKARMAELTARLEGTDEAQAAASEARQQAQETCAASHGE